MYTPRHASNMEQIYSMIKLIHSPIRIMDSHGEFVYTGRAIHQLRRMGVPIPAWSDRDYLSRPVLHWAQVMMGICPERMYVSLPRIEVRGRALANLLQCASAYHAYVDLAQHGALV